MTAIETYQHAGRQATTWILFGYNLQPNDTIQVTTPTAADLFVLGQNYFPRSLYPSDVARAFADAVNANPKTFGRLHNRLQHGQAGVYAIQYGRYVSIRALRPGTAGNEFEVTKSPTNANITISSATLTGGEDWGPSGGGGLPIFSPVEPNTPGNFVGQTWYRVQDSSIIGTWIWDGTTWLVYGA